MRKLKILILLLNLFSVEIVLSQNCNYQVYNNFIELANKEKLSGNLKEANKYFQLAFENTDFPFGNDLSYALETAVQTKDKVFMEKIAIKLAKGGIPKEFFEKFESYKWHKTFIIEFPNYQKYYFENFNQELKKSLIELERYDYTVNSHFHEWRTRKIEHSTDTLVSEFTKVSKKFQNIVEKFGFPSERNFGYYYNKKRVYELPTFVILTHIYQRGELLYIDKLNQLYCDGNLNYYQSNQLLTIRGFGNSSGIYQEMQARKNKFRKNE